MRNNGLRVVPNPPFDTVSPSGNNAFWMRILLGSVALFQMPGCRGPRGLGSGDEHLRSTTHTIEFAPKRAGGSLLTGGQFVSLRGKSWGRRSALRATGIHE